MRWALFGPARSVLGNSRATCRLSMGESAQALVIHEQPQTISPPLPMQLLIGHSSISMLTIRLKRPDMQTNAWTPRCPFRYDIPMGHVNRRRITALIAAYAVAMQALVSALMVAPKAALAFPEFVICGSVGNDTGAPVHPPSHDFCPACLAGHCVGAAGCDRAASDVVWPSATVFVAALVPRVARPSSAPRARHFARAPPAG